MAITFDPALMMAGRVAGAIEPPTWRDGAAAVRDAHALLERWRAAGELGFLDLAQGGFALDELRRFADGVGQAFSDVVVLGIGGSALGARALRGALRPPAWNARSDDDRDFFPRLHVADNIDPAAFHALLERLELARTLFLVVSKSGATSETLAQYLVVRERLREAVGAGSNRHLVFITDPEKGPLRAIARAEGIVSMEIPPNVGGRFSVLSPVGLLPAALIGIDVAALLDGAAAMRARCAAPDPEANPAAAYALLQWLADAKLGMHTHVMMPYSSALRDFAAWFAQLWAESLGKKRADGSSTGPTPLAALGVTDQHSQLQLFMEGPRDKTVTFIAVGGRETDVVVPRASGDDPAFAHVAGRTLGALMDAERRATAAALAANGRPSMTITLERGDAWHVGGLLMMMEIAVVYAGALYGVDPFGQPGVELGKRLATEELRGG